MVFMDYIVAVHHVAAMKVFPAHENFNLVVGEQSGNVAPHSSHEHTDRRTSAFESAFGRRRASRQRFNVDKLIATQWVFRIAGLNLFWPKGLAIHLVKQELSEMRVDRM